MPASCPSDCARERGADSVGVGPLRGVLNANCATAPSLRGEGFAARGLPLGGRAAAPVT